MGWVPVCGVVEVRANGSTGSVWRYSCKLRANGSMDSGGLQFMAPLILQGVPIPIALSVVSFHQHDFSGGPNDPGVFGSCMVAPLLKSDNRWC